MPLGRQANTLSMGQIEAVVGYLNSTKDPLRNRVIFYLSMKAGLRAKEIASLTWAHDHRSLWSGRRLHPT
jgi:integrase/recombinase XerD